MFIKVIIDMVSQIIYRKIDTRLRPVNIYVFTSTFVKNVFRYTRMYVCMYVL